jgi:hypothetical protein
VGAITGEDRGIEKFDGTDFGYWKMQIEDYVWYKFATGAHKYDYEEKKKNMMILVKEGLLWLRWSYSRRNVDYLMEFESRWRLLGKYLKFLC